MKQIIILLIVIVPGICNANYEQSISFHDANMHDGFIGILKAKNINYRLKNKKIHYHIRDTSRINKLEKEFILNDMPSDRSINVHDKHLRECLVSHLVKNNVNFTIKDRYNEKWIVTENYSLNNMRAIFKQHCRENRN